MILSINVIVRNKLPTSVGREFEQSVIDFPSLLLSRFGLSETL